MFLATPTPSSACRSTNYKYTGPTIETRDYNLSECEEKCNQNGHCKYWSWSPDIGNKCSFFGQTPSKVSASGSYTGERDCPSGGYHLSE